MNNKLVLYSTEGCHLCEQAHAMLLSVGITPQIIDIIHDDILFARYGVTIPVLRSNDDELNWPFDTEQLQHWLEKTSARKQTT